MKLKSTLLLSATALGASALVAFAQQGAGNPTGGPGGPPPGGGGPGGAGGGGPGGPGGRPVPPLIVALDTNHDGVIDADEIANAPASLKTLDKNGDGKLTPDEYAPPRRGGGPRGPGGAGKGSGQAEGENAGAPGGPGGAGGRGGRREPPLVAALDTNHDGVIDASEIANAPASLKTLDKNGDGKLTRDELRPPRGEGGGRPPQGRKGNNADQPAQQNQ